MPNFIYSALDAKGEEKTGVISANSESDAIQQLRGNGLYPTQIQQEGKGTKKAKAAIAQKAKAKGKAKPAGKVGGSVKPKNLTIFTRQLATLIDSGLPLLRSLTVLEKQELSVGLEHPMNLTQCRCNIRNGAQRKSTDYGIEAIGIERQLLRR